MTMSQLAKAQALIIKRRGKSRRIELPAEHARRAPFYCGKIGVPPLGPLQQTLKASGSLLDQKFLRRSKSGAYRPRIQG
jgi:hypothetical protein